MLRGFILRRFVCGESSRSYGLIFARALSKVEPAPPLRLEAFLLERGWPDDRRFISKFVELPLYESTYTKHVLASLERARGHKEPADLQKTEIEHVLPQAMNDMWRADLGPEAERIHVKWLHSPGNLTLSGYNAELWNHRFSVKRTRYAQSNVVLTREIADYEHWDEQTIIARGKQLAAEAARIWIGPPEQSALQRDSLDQRETDDVSRFKARHKGNVVEDLSVWDESTVPRSNAGIVNLKHKIDSMVATLNLAGLESLTFKGSAETDQASTYYRRAGQYLRAHIAKVRTALVAHEAAILGNTHRET
jgi:hypothetical protein